MQTFKIANELLPEFLESLKEWGELWAPVEKNDGVYVFSKLDDVSRARPDVNRTLLPPKKLLLQPSFTMLESSGGQILERSLEATKPIVLFGVHACDIHAIAILDLLYLTDYVDPYYKHNRKRLIVVGYGCWPDENCFCQSMGTSTVDEGFDLFLTPLEGRHLVTVGSSVGDDMVRSLPHLFEKASKDDIRAFLARLKEREKAFKLELDVTDLPYVLELKKDDPVWQELGAKCLCCGSCSMVCPTCSCFNVYDRFELDGSAKRIRSWDSCLYSDYALVAGGHNFRAERSERVKNRYYHKQEAFVREFGRPSCVGCGRCIESCPTRINVVEVFQRVRGEL